MNMMILPPVMEEVLSDPDFWEALQRSEVEHREVRPIIETSFGVQAFSISYSNAVPFMDWFGRQLDVPAGESHQIVLREQLLAGISSSIPRGNSIGIKVCDEKYGPVVVKIGCIDNGEDLYFRIEMVEAI